MVGLMEMKQQFRKDIMRRTSWSNLFCLTIKFREGGCFFHSVCYLLTKNNNVPLGHKGRVFFLRGKIFFYSGFAPYVLHNINNQLVNIHILKGKNKIFTLKTWKLMWKRKNDVYWYSLVGSKGFKLCIPLKSDEYYSFSI